MLDRNFGVFCFHLPNERRKLQSQKIKIAILIFSCVFKQVRQFSRLIKGVTPYRFRQPSDITSQKSISGAILRFISRIRTRPRIIALNGETQLNAIFLIV